MAKFVVPKLARDIVSFEQCKVVSLLVSDQRAEIAHRPKLDLTDSYIALTVASGQ